MTAVGGAVTIWLRRLAVLNLLANVAIVVTGGAVRLTGSGLGCPTWPRCTDDSYVVHGELGIHGAIEFGNRMLTFVLAAVAIACFVVAWRSGHAAATRLSTVIALGVPAQALIGGVVVMTALDPWLVGFHLLVSMAMIAVCVWLVRVTREAPPWSPTSGVGAGRLRWETTARLGPAARLAWLALAVGWATFGFGTIVTGSGPHSGDENAGRTGLDPQLMSHVHAVAVYVLVALSVGLVALALRLQHPELRRAATILLGVELAQGAVGFVQYHLDLPEALVAVHLLGAALTSAALANTVLSAYVPELSRGPGQSADEPRRGSSATATKSRLR